MFSIRLSRRPFLAGLCAFFFLCSSSVHAASLNEYQIKAAFLFQFTKFVEWPQEKLPPREFTICVMGKDPFGPVLDEIRGEKVKDRSTEIKRVEAENADSCQLLFISASEEKRLHEILGALQNKQVLTVSDIPEFTERGGMIRFVKRDNRIRFEINPKNANASGLKISSKLLNISSRVVAV